MTHSEIEANGEDLGDSFLHYGEGASDGGAA